MPFPIETDRLTIRAFSKEDLAPLHETMRSDPEVMRYLSSPVATTVEETAEALERWMERQEADGLSRWAVVEKASGDLVGSCGIHAAQWVGPEVEIAYMFGRRYWGRGYATESAHACLAYGFGELGIDRIVAFILPANSASIRVAERLGMVIDGTVRPYGHDVLRYAVLRDAV